MKIKFLVAASLSAVPASAFQDSDKSDRCKPTGIMTGVHKAEPVKPERSPKALLLPKAQTEANGPAMLIPNYREKDTKRRKKHDHPLALNKRGERNVIKTVNRLDHCFSYLPI